jgi:hypothetical protein
VGSLGAGGAAAGGGGGGGGGARFDDAEVVRAWLVPFDNAATGCGTALRCAGAGAAAGVGAAAGAGLGRAANLDGAPPGPPGRSSLPLVIGFAATCFPLGVGFDCELGGSPADV